MRRFFACTLSLVIGCSEAPKAEMTRLEDVPESVMAVAREKLPGVTIEQAMKRPDGIYVIGGKDNRGKVREIELSEDGEVVEVE